MRRLARPLGTLLVAGGLLTIAWTLVVWAWKDPFTTLYTAWEQHRLADRYEQRVAALDLDFGALRPEDDTASLPTAQRRELAAVARRYRSLLREGDALGRIEVPRLDVELVVVEGTSAATLRKGPGRHRSTFLPGEGRLIYVAGHRTTYGAPFARLDQLRAGDRVVLEVPYGRFEYRVTRSIVVRADQTEVLRSKRREEVALQACHPRFFASHRLIAYAVPVRVELDGAVYHIDDTRIAAG